MPIGGEIGKSSASGSAIQQSTRQSYLEVNHILRYGIPMVLDFPKILSALTSVSVNCLMRSLARTRQFSMASNGEKDCGCQSLLMPKSHMTPAKPVRHEEQPQIAAQAALYSAHDSRPPRCAEDPSQPILSRHPRRRTQPRF